MTEASDKEWATKYLLDPLTAPEPCDETGPGTHFVRDFNTLRKGKNVQISNLPTPPLSASPSRGTFSSNNPYNSYSPTQHHRQQAFAAYEKPNRSQNGEGSHSHGRRRAVSLQESPLEAIKKEAKAAHRSPHLRKKHIPHADTIDSLDKSFGFAYHHEGPYDATLRSRNLTPKTSPIEAVRRSNEEALKATPKENIRDALERHVPLQGTASIPPGEPDFSGNEMRYEEGADLMREPDAAGGAYKRWADMKYHSDDLKGKGEPSYTIEEALKENKRISSDAASEYEMLPQQRATSSRLVDPPPRRNFTRLRSQSNNDVDGAMSRGFNPDGFESKEMNARTSGIASGSTSRARGNSNSENTGTKLGQGLKKRFGSLRIGKSSGDKSTGS